MSSDFRTSVKKRRAKLGLSQEDLAKVLDDDQRKTLWLTISAMCDEYAEKTLEAKRERRIESAGKAIRIKLKSF